MVFFLASFLHIGLEGNRALISSGISILTFPDGPLIHPKTFPMNQIVLRCISFQLRSP